MRHTKIFILVAIVFSFTIILGYYGDRIEVYLKGNQYLAFLVEDPSDSDDGEGRSSGVVSPIEPLYVTVTGSDPVFGYSFQQMNRLPQEESLEKEPALPVAIQTNDRMHAGESTVPALTGTIEQRGFSARRVNLKSYKIRLDDEQTIWGQEIINLNKHSLDFTKVRNKLSFDLFKQIPGIVSMDTHFVRLYVKDETAFPTTGQFADYGLYTHIEQPNGDFLRRNRLDPDGYLYKAVNFEFYRYPEKIRDRNDPRYNKNEFETLLSIEGREYHEKLIKMLEDINNDNNDFERVFSRHFNKDNFLTWMAVNLLMGNIDTTGNNYFLYSSRFSDTWYFLPWDFDKAWNFEWQYGFDGSAIHPAREGLSLYWGWPLTRRFFQNPSNVEALNRKMEEVADILSEQRIRSLLDEYYPVVQPLVFQSTEPGLLPEDYKTIFDEEYYSLAKYPALKLQRYYENLEKPMPVFIGGPYAAGDKLTFNWGTSYDLQGDDIFYDFAVSDSPDFAEILHAETGLTKTEIVIDSLAPGEYYWRVKIRDSQGREQVAFESYTDPEGNFFHGVKHFTIQ